MRPIYWCKSVLSVPLDVVGSFGCCRFILLKRFAPPIWKTWLRHWVQTYLTQQEIHLFISKHFALFPKLFHNNIFAFAFNIACYRRQTSCNQCVSFIGNFPGMITGGAIDICTLWNTIENVFKTGWVILIILLIIQLWVCFFWCQVCYRIFITVHTINEPNLRLFI